MIELEALNWSFQLLFYIYDMISDMSRADVKDVLFIMHLMLVHQLNQQCHFGFFLFLFYHRHLNFQTLLIPYI